MMKMIPELSRIETEYFAVCEDIPMSFDISLYFSSCYVLAAMDTKKS